MKGKTSIIVTFAVLTLVVGQTAVHAKDISLTRQIDEFTVDRSVINKKTKPLANTTSNQAFEWKSNLGLYLGVEESPETANNDAAGSTQPSSLADTYVGIRQAYSDFSYNLGMKSYNHNFDTMETEDLNKLNVNEYFLGARIMNIGFGVSQSDLLQHKRASYFRRVMDTALQFDLGQTVTNAGENYYEWRLNATKEYRELNFSFSMKKNFTDSVSEPAEVRFGLSKSLDMK